MIRHILFLILLVSAFNVNSENALISIGCSAELRPYVEKVQKLPEVQQLMAEIFKEGPIQFIKADQQVAIQFGACWDIERRIIFVSMNQTEGRIIGSILFEMQNARVSAQLEALDKKAEKGTIGREDYVKGIEYIEYLNSKNAAALAEKGIQEKLFPQDARLYTYRDFDEHYRMQIYGGHSAYIGETYDMLRR